jgi:putative thioredoxin
MNNLVDTPSIKDSSDEEFMVDVIEASKDLPILVDFWAPWCGPCKTLGPALEAAVKENQKKIKLVKIDIDKNPNIAGQLRVQSIPAVFAFSNGQPVDGFMGAQTPSQIQDFIKKIIDGFGPEDDNLTAAIASANELLEKNDYNGAIEIFTAVKAQDPNLTEAHIGLIKCLLNSKDLDAAKLAYEAIPDAIKPNANVKTIFAQIQLAEQTLTAGKLVDVRQKFLLSPENLDLKFDLALALISEEQNEEAIDTLLQIIQKKASWGEGKAKSQLIELLDALGPENQIGRAGRRRLSSILFS